MYFRMLQSGIDKAPTNPVVCVCVCVGGGSQACRILKFLVGSFGLYFILLTQGSILDPCYEI